MEAGLKIHFAALQDEIDKDNIAIDAGSDVRAGADPTLAMLSTKSYHDFYTNHKLRKQLRKVLKSRGAYVDCPLPSKHSSYETILPNPEKESLSCDYDASSDAAGTAIKLKKQKCDNDDVSPDLQPFKVIASANKQPLAQSDEKRRDCTMDGDNDEVANEDKPPGLPPPSATPTIFRLRSRSRSSAQTDVDTANERNAGSLSTDHDEELVYITAPVLAVSGDFRMRVLHGQLGQTTQTQTTQDCGDTASADTSEKNGKEEDDDWRPCETRLQVLARGFYNGQPVTKVRLMPVSGRRHQLRLHCLLLGHPIGRDVFYVLERKER